MIIKAISVGQMQVNCYILASRSQGSAVIIDPGSQEDLIRKALDKDKLRPGIVINTHGHFDHIGCDDAFGVPVYVHRSEEAMVRDPGKNLSAMFSTPVGVTGEVRTVVEGDSIEHDEISLKILHIPGHTTGGMALVLEKPQQGIVFTGDSLFYHAIGRCDIEDGDEALLTSSIREKLFVLPDDTILYPGHGPSSTIGEERKNNPFF